MATPTVEPNLYELRGATAKIVYSSTSFSGKPQLSYERKKGTLNFTGDEIRTAETEIGKLVTVTVEVVPDLRTVTLTLLLPRINVSGTGSKQTFRTIAITTTERTSIGGPALVKGAVQTYKTLELRGTAKVVEFLAREKSTGI